MIPLTKEEEKMHGRQQKKYAIYRKKNLVLMIKNIIK